MLIEGCQHYIPTLSAQLLCNVEDEDLVKRLLGQLYAGLSTKFEDEFYQNYTVRLKQLRALENHLTTLPILQSNILLALESHDSLPLDNALLRITFQNMRCLQEEVVHVKNLTKTTFCEILDRYPSRAEAQLRSLVKEVSLVFQEFFLIDSSCICQIGDNRNLLDGKLPNISFHNFKTLGACQWLDDEIINYFVNKWCSRSSTTLGLSTFFACKFLFQDDDNSCVHARHGILTGEDEYSALRWCRRAEVSCSHFTHSMTVLLPFTRGVWGLI